MAQERARPPGNLQRELSADPAGADPAQRTYREEEVVRILQRAARLERDRHDASPTLTLGEIESIARESGIDLALVRQAAGELETAPERDLGTILAGAPVRRVVERVVEGEIGTEHHEALAGQIRSVLAATGAVGIPPSVAVLGRSLTVTGWARGGVVEVQVAPRKGKTFIRLESNSAPLAGGLFGGIIGGIGGGVGANVGWIIPTLLHLPVAAGLAGAAVVVAGAYALARAIFVGQAGSLHRRMEVLAERLASEVKELTGPGR